MTQENITFIIDFIGFWVYFSKNINIVTGVSMAKQILFSFELEPGMVVCDDVFDPTGRLILPKGMVLDNDTISKLEFFSILEVPIDNELHIKPEETAPANTIENYSEKVKKSPEYKHFSSDFQEILTMVKHNLDDLAVKHIPVNSDALIKGVFCLIKDCRNTIQLFDILHNMESTTEQTYHHSLNVAVISIILGKWLGMPRKDLEQLALAGILHDVGKLTVPKGILNKSGKLTDEEFALVKSHVKKGYNILKEQELDIRVKEACLLHHERCDGSGYPFKVKLEKITPFAKIIAIADVYDAMTSSRSYRNGLCPFDVIRMFDSEGLYKYDPQYIMTFLENMVSSYLHNNVLLSDGRVGEIIMINKICLYRPVVKCKDGFVDLLKNQDISIESIIS